MLVGFTFAAIAAISLLLIQIANRSSALEDALARARDTGEVEPVARALASDAEDDQATEWNEVIDDLWQSYHREEAARLVVEAVDYTDATILQYWMREIMQVEPDIANKVFDEDFLEEHFDPEVASRCGSSGCCP